MWSQGPEGESRSARANRSVDRAGEAGSMAVAIVAEDRARDHRPERSRRKHICQGRHR
jgi:hypothetical protein